MATCHSTTPGQEDWDENDMRRQLKILRTENLVSGVRRAVHAVKHIFFWGVGQFLKI